MALSNPKNAVVSGAVTDLGLGDQLEQQAEEEENLRKKLTASTGSAPGGSGLMGASAALLGSGTGGV